MSRARLAVLFAGLLLSAAPQAARAQAVQVAPFGGYRFGGELYDLLAGVPLYIDGAPCVGVTVDLFVHGDTSLSFLYSRQQTRVEGAGPWGSNAASANLFIEHWHVGGTVELDGGAVRPFLAGTVGLTRFGGAGESEVRFSAAGGAGVKLMASRHVGARLDGRVYAVVVDGGIGRMICGGSACLIDLDVGIAWQGELTAGLVLSF